MASNKIILVLVGGLMGCIHGITLWATSGINVRTVSLLATGDMWRATELVTGIIDILIVVLVVSAIWWGKWIEQYVESKLSEQREPESIE